MQEIKKRIVFASVLKPVDDTRMFEKMAQTLAVTDKYEVHVIGYPSQNEAYHANNIALHPSSTFKRLSLARLVASVKVVKKLWVLKPHLLIINSHELLGVSVTIKFFLRCKLIYDVQENYFLNILYTKTFPLLLRPILAFYVRAKEVTLSPFIDYFILAEKGYEREFKFAGTNKITIENKALPPYTTPKKKSTEDGFVHLLFSGTLAETTGVFQSISLAIKLHAIQPKIRLTIIGYCAQENVLMKLKREIQPQPFIKLIGGDHLIPHTTIVHEIYQSDFGIIAYPYNASTENSIPTKLYEYLAGTLPILLTNYKPWVDQCAPYTASIAIDFDHIEASDILNRMIKTKFYTSNPADVFWESDKFVELIKRI